MIQLNRITKRFDGVIAVDSVTTDIHAGRIVGFLGPNGAGKTTTIRMIMNIIQPDEGEILFEGKLKRPSTTNIGYLPEERGLYQKISVQETISYFARLRGLQRPDAQIKSFLERFELADRAHSKVQELSKGNQQKLQFINTIIHDPQFIILDEPFTGLDPVNQMLLKTILRELKAAGKTIIFSSHQMEQVERIVDDVALVNHGKLVLSGDLTEIRKTHGQSMVEVIPERTIDLDHPRLKELSATFVDGRALITLTDSGMKDAIFKELPGIMNLRSIRQAEPGLEEIFISAVQGGDQ